MILDFMKYYPGRSGIMLICLVFAGISEGLGIATMLPLLNLAVRENSPGASPIGDAVENFLTTFGIAPGYGVLLALIVTGIIFKSGFTLFAMKQVGYTIAYVVTDLRLSLFRALLKARWDYFVQQPAGGFSNAVSTEALRLSDGYRMACIILAEAILVFFYIVVAMLISWQVACISIVVGFVIMTGLKPLVRMARNAGERQTKAFHSLLVRMTELLHNIKPVKAMARENRVGPLLEADSVKLKYALQRQVLSVEILNTLQEPLIVIFLALGLYSVLAYGKVPMTNLLIMAFLFQRVVFRVGKLQKRYQAMCVSESAYWSFRQRLTAIESVDEVISGQPAPKLSREITFQNIRFSYGDCAILNDVTFTLPFGKMTVITGISGEGKTTLADMTAGLIRPLAGEIYMDGVPLSRIDLHDWRRQIGYVPQEMMLFHDTVLSNITFGDNALSRDQVREALEKSGALHFVDRLPQGLDTVVGEHGARLSGGQRQRIALARALVHRPRLLILDEVTTALDPKTESGICSALVHLLDEMAILAISHQPAITAVADRVCELRNGKLEIIKNGADRTKKYG